MTTVFAKKHPNGDVDIHRTVETGSRCAIFPGGRSNTPKKNQKQVIINAIKYNLSWLEDYTY